MAKWDNNWIDPTNHIGCVFELLSCVDIIPSREQMEENINKRKKWQSFDKIQGYVNQDATKSSTLWDKKKRKVPFFLTGSSHQTHITYRKHQLIGEIEFSFSCNIIKLSPSKLFVRNSGSD